MRNVTVASVMTSDVLTAREAMPLKEFARVLTTRAVSALPVLDADDRLVGMVSERDLLDKQADPLASYRSWWGRLVRPRHARRATGDTVADVMTKNPVTIGPNASLAEAAKQMARHRIKRLPVVDGQGALVGIVSRGDLLKVFVRSDDDIAELILREVFVRLLWADPTEVEVRVTDGVVTLAGRVESRSVAEIAERLSRQTDGVIDVVNELTCRTDDRAIRRH